MDTPTIELSGLTLAEFYDLEAKLGEKFVKQTASKSDKGKYGVLDPVTAVVIVTVFSLQVLATWLNKREEKVNLERVDVTKNADGSETASRHTISYSRSESDADVIKQLNAGVPGVPDLLYQLDC
jgi:hypothetical protein